MLVLELGMRGDGWTAPCPSSFTSQKRALPVPIQQETGRAPDPVWMVCGSNNLLSLPKVRFFSSPVSLAVTIPTMTFWLLVRR